MGRGRGRGAPPPPPPAGLPARGPRTPAGPQPQRKLKSFFWDKLPDSRVPATFWEHHRPDYKAVNTKEVGLHLVSGGMCSDCSHAEHGPAC